MEKLNSDTLNLFKDIFCNVGGCADCSHIQTCVFIKFALEAMFFGFISLIIDFIIFKSKKISYLKQGYTGGFLSSLIFWTIGSLLVGYLGAVFHLLDTSQIQSAAFVGIGWQLIFAQIAAKKFEPDDSQPINAT